MMKPFKVLGNTAGLTLAMAVLLVFLSTRTTFFSTLDSILFDISTRLISKPEIPDIITLVTLPTTDAGSLVDNLELTSELISFLEKLKSAMPEAVVFILDGYPQAVVNTGLIQVEARLEQALAATDTAQQTDLSGVLAYARALSGPGAQLARAIKKNDVLVAAKINSRRDIGNTSEQDLYPGQPIAATDPGRQSILDWLPAPIWLEEMPSLGDDTERAGETTGYETAIPLYSSDTKGWQWPMVWKCGDRFVPDLVTRLYQKTTDSAEPVWVEGKGVRFDYYMMRTDFSGRLRPLLLTSGSRDREIETVPMGEMALEKKVGALKDRIVLIGSAADPSLRSTALAFLSMRAEATAHTPLWASWLGTAAVLLFAAYLILLLRRMRPGVGSVFSVLLLLLTFAMQWGVLVTKGIWLPVSAAMAYLVAGHVLMQFRFHTTAHLLKLGTKKHDAFFELGTHYAESRRFDKAVSAFRECLPKKEVLDALYDVGLEYERRQKLKKACGVFQYIDGQRKDFRGAGKRAGQLTDLLEGRGGSGGDGAETVSMPTFEIQRTVLGRYEIERELGRGAMGVVYLGRDPKIGRRVAIKTLDLAERECQSGDHETAKRRFFREAEAIGRLHHPNIVTVYDVGEEDDLAFIAMDFLTGRSLMLHADISNLLPVPTVYDIAAQVAEALAYAHSQHVIHRDIKPGNIIYDGKEGRVVVTDFGIARLVDATLTSTHTILGSPSFMAPEQLKGSKVDGRADIFSLGVTFFQLLTGRFPFGGRDLATITYKITHEEAPDITGFRTGLPESARGIVFKALAKEPDERYQTAAEMAEALRSGAPKATGGRKKK